jgi:hypothetical protein
MKALPSLSTPTATCGPLIPTWLGRQWSRSFVRRGKFGVLVGSSDLPSLTKPRPDGVNTLDVVVEHELLEVFR